ncbi:MAG: hypothetical protein PVH17_03770 [Anaerolineae bacterium]|jgi:hypothetical protein
MAKKQKSPQALIAEGTLRLQQRNDRTWQPLLRDRIAQLVASIEEQEMQVAARAEMEADG